MKTNINFFEILLLVIFLTSCGGSNSGELKSEQKIVGMANIGDQEINMQLFDKISSYVSEVDGNFYDKEWLYYSLYFFRDESAQYFTIWTFASFPGSSFFKDDPSSYSYSLHRIMERKIVFVFDQQSDYTGLFTMSQQSYELAKMEMEKKHDVPIYDGKWFFRTYKILKDGEKYQFDKLEKAIVFFLKIQPPDSYLE